MAAPLGAELTNVVEAIERKNPGIFGNFGAYGQVFALYTCTLDTFMDSTVKLVLDLAANASNDMSN